MASSLTTSFRYWKQGIRLYVALGVALLTVIVWWWSAASYSGSVLYATRIEEAYAWLSLVLLAIALLIGPLYKTLPELGARHLLFDARRMIGIGAAWFATLHATIAYVALFKAANPLSLPVAYQRAFLIGAGALVILLAMAFTSFDKAFRGMGIWWFRLHRLVYVAAALALLHAFLIGVHATESLVIIILSTLTFTTVIMHIRNQKLGLDAGHRWQTLGLLVITIALLGVFWYGYEHPPSTTSSTSTGVAQSG